MILAKLKDRAPENWQSRLSKLRLACECALAALALVYVFMKGAAFVGIRDAVLVAFAIALCAHADSRVRMLEGKARVVVWALAVLYAFGWAVGGVLVNSEASFEVSHVVARAFLVFIGAFFLFRAAIVELSVIASKAVDNSAPWEVNPLVACVVVTAVSAMYLVVFYPGVTFNDGMRQLHSWLGNIAWTNHDPAFSTMLIGICASIGRAVADDNFGMFLYNLLVLTASSLVFWRAFALLRDLRSSKGTGVFAVAFWCILPTAHLYLITICKDTAFALATMTLVIFLADIMRRRRDGGSATAGDYAKVLLCMVLMCNFRNDGIWVSLFALFVAFVAVRDFRVVSAAGMAVLLVFHVVYGSVLLPALGIGPGSVREALSVPVQQIALLARDHPESFSSDDERFVRELFSCDVAELGGSYDPELSDPVKGRLVERLDGERAKCLAMLWLDGLMAHPDSYLFAYLSNYYGYLYPDKIGDEPGFTTFSVSDYYQFDMDHHFADWSHFARAGISKFQLAIMQLPVVSWAYCPGFYTWAVAACVALALARGRKGDAIPLAPLVGVLIIACLSPVDCRVRYVLSLVFCLPVVVGWAEWLVRQRARSRPNE